MQHISAASEEERKLMPQAPAPLLPNFGEGRIMQYYLDLAVRSIYTLT